MARRTFFSFHYKPDVQRAQVVRNSWVTKPNRESAGFFDSSVFESKRRTSDDALKRFLREGLKNTSVTAVLAGTETASRRWVRYELVESFKRGNGILAINVHKIAGFDGRPSKEGVNPLDDLAFTVVDDRVRFKERKNGKWQFFEDSTSMALSDVAYSLGDRDNHTFATLFSKYCWVTDRGYDNLGTWVEAAAKKAGK